jgi:hypothetical protein
VLPDIEDISATFLFIHSLFYFASHGPDLWLRGRDAPATAAGTAALHNHCCLAQRNAAIVGRDLLVRMDYEPA